MDWKVFFVTFGTIFLAELADKTQLVGIGMSAKSGKPRPFVQNSFAIYESFTGKRRYPWTKGRGKPWIVWLGSVSAYLIITAGSVFLGSVAGKYMKPEVIKYAGASLFVIIGLLMLLGKV